MANYPLTAEVRTAFGTNAVKKLRRDKINSRQYLWSQQRKC